MFKIQTDSPALK